MPHGAAHALSRAPGQPRAPLATAYPRRRPDVGGDDIVRFLRDLKGRLGRGGEVERANLVASVYDRIVVTDKGIWRSSSWRMPCDTAWPSRCQSA
jgi:hypothetical protein